MKKQFPKFKRNESEKIFNKLPATEQKERGKFLEYMVARGCSSKSRQGNVKRVWVQLRTLYEKPLANINLEDYRSLIAIIKQSSLSDEYKNENIVYLNAFLKWKFQDWSIRFNEFGDGKQIKKPANKRMITPDNVIKKEEVEKMIKHEPKMFFKAFLITQYEAGLRTGECRTLKWDDLDLNGDGDISEINLFSTKNKKRRSVFIKESTFYLQKLKEEQENLKDKGVYIFHSKDNPNQPIGKGSISNWFKDLSTKALGKPLWNYLLRHGRATELYRLSRQGKIAKSTAQEFMGHNEDMEGVYLHMDNNELKDIIKNQVYKIEELPPEKKSELQEKIEQQQKELEELKKQNEMFARALLILEKKGLIKKN